MMFVAGCSSCIYLRPDSLPRKYNDKIYKNNAHWTNSEADICCYMDIDLSTDLAALKPMIEALLSKKLNYIFCQTFTNIEVRKFK